MFTHREVDEVDLIFTYFKSPMVQIPRTDAILPLKTNFENDEQWQAQEVWEKDDPTDFSTLVYEPEAGEMLPYLASYYLKSQIFTALILFSFF